MSLTKEALRDAASKLTSGDADFANSLLRGWERYGHLTDRQMVWAVKLVDRATNPKPPPETVKVGDFAGVMQLFAHAAQHLRYPRIRLLVGDQPVQLSLAGERSKAPGTVNVTDGGGYGSGVWFGRVAPDGTWTKGRDATPEIEEFLRKFSAHPAQVAAEYGRLTGNCCFCRRPLDDERSTAVGYGPVCAENYGLKAEWKAATPALKGE